MQCYNVPETHFDFRLESASVTASLKERIFCTIPYPIIDFDPPSSFGFSIPFWNFALLITLYLWVSKLVKTGNRSDSGLV